MNAGADGSFTLPLFEKSQSVVACNEEGFAQISLADLKASPQIKLQKWGRIEATLQINHHPGTNERVMLSQPARFSKMTVRKRGGQTNDLEITNSAAMDLPPLIYDSNAFQVPTDEQGHFAISFVPPGVQSVARLVAEGNGSWRHVPLGSVLVKAGETVTTNFNLTGRTVVGKLKFTGSNAPADFQHVQGSLHSSGVLKMIKQLAGLKTADERKAFSKSVEGKFSPGDYRDFPVTVNADGTFRATDVAAGKYEFGGQILDSATRHLPTRMTMFLAVKEIVIADAKDKADETPVDCGTVELEEIQMPIDPTATEAK